MNTLKYWAATVGALFFVILGFIWGLIASVLWAFFTGADHIALCHLYAAACLTGNEETAAKIKEEIRGTN